MVATILPENSILGLCCGDVTVKSQSPLEAALARPDCTISGTLSGKTNQIIQLMQNNRIGDNTMKKSDFQTIGLSLFAICISMLYAGMAYPADPSGQPEAGMIVTDDRQTDQLNVERQENEEQFNWTIARYNQRIQDLEIENGVYNNDLGEELVGLGLAYAGAGEYQPALEAYTRALQINRINNGLHSLNQLPILERTIETNTVLENYADLTANHDYLLWLYMRNYDSNDPQLLPVLFRVAHWNLDAYEVMQRPESVGNLIKAANLFHQAIHIIESTGKPDDPRIINALYGIANANFKFVEPFGVIPNIDAFFSGTTTPLLPSNFERDIRGSSFARNRHSNIHYNQDRLTQILQNQENSVSLVRDSYRSGRNALQRIIEIHEQNPDLPKISHAYALTHLGDWYLRFNKRNSAISSYAQAYQMLQEDHDEKTIERLFGRPHSLDALGIPAEFTQGLGLQSFASEAITGEADSTLVRPADLDLENSQFILVEFDVTEYGSVRNFEILASNPEDSVSFRRMARSKITNTPFRPRLENGKPVKTDDVKILYRFN